MDDACGPSSGLSTSLWNRTPDWAGHTESDPWGGWQGTWQGTALCVGASFTLSLPGFVTVPWQDYLDLLLEVNTDEIPQITRAVRGEGGVKWIPWGTLEGRQVLWLMAKSEEGTSREALMAPKEQLCNLVHENVNSQPSLQLMATMWTAKLPSQSTQYLPPRAPSCLISLQIWIKAGPERLPSPKFQTH